MPNPDGSLTLSEQLRQFGGIDSVQTEGFSPNQNAGTDVETAGLDTNTDLGGYKGILAGIQGFGALANAYLGYKALELGRDKFDFSKSSFNRNLANQASLTNTQLEAQQRSRLAGQGIYDRTTASGREALQADLDAYLEPRRVSGAPVG